MCPPSPGPGAPGPPRARCPPIRPSPPPSASSRGEQESLLVSVQRGAESEATPSAGGDRGAVEGETPADGHRQVADVVRLGEEAADAFLHHLWHRAAAVGGDGTTGHLGFRGDHAERLLPAHGADHDRALRHQPAQLLAPQPAEPDGAGEVDLIRRIVVSAGDADVETGGPRPPPFRAHTLLRGGCAPAPARARGAALAT